MFFTDVQTAPIKIPRWVLVLVPLLVALCVYLGYLYYHREYVFAVEDTNQDLRVVAEAKSKQIIEWRGERLSDAKFIYSNKNIASRATHLEDHHFPQADYNQTLSWMDAMFKNGHYSRMMLLDSHKNVVIALPSTSSSLSEQLRGFIDTVAQTRKIFFTDFHIDDKQRPEIDLVIPICDSTISTALLGVVVLEMDPAQYLYPVIQAWPTWSKTAEVILFQKDGDSVLYLNELRHKQNSALKFKYSVSDALLPAAMFIRGNQGFVNGVDYRGVPVHAYGLKITDSPWYLLTKIDDTEIYAQVSSEWDLILLLLAGVVISAGGVLAFISRYQHAKYFKALYTSEAEKVTLASRYEFLIKHANDGIALIDAQYHFIDCNERLCEITGYTRDELLSMTIKDLRTAESFKTIQLDWEGIGNSDGSIYETVNKKKDGTLIHLELSVRKMEMQGKDIVQAIARDITERKKAEEKIALLNRWYLTLSEMNQAIVRASDVQSMFEGICDVAVKFGKFDLAWIGTVDASGNKITPTAVKSTTNVTPAKIEPYLHEAMKRNGPIASSVRSKSPQICVNVFTDERLKQWSAELQVAGIQSYASIPILRGEEIVAVFCVFASVPHFVNQEELRLMKEVRDDISFAIERFDALGLLKKSEERYRGLFEHMTEGFAYCQMIYDGDEPVDWIYLAVNESFGMLTGLKNIVGRRATEAIPGIYETDRELFKLYSQTAITGEPNRFERYVEALQMWFSLSVYSPQQGFFVAVFDVITKRKKAEQALKESEEKFKELFNSAPAGYHELDTNGIIVNVNQTELAMLGYSLEEMVGKPIWEFIGDKKAARERVIAKLEGVFHNDASVERTFVKKDGTTIPVLSDEIVLKNSQGEIIGIRTVIQNIEEKKQTEADLLKLRAAVEASNEIVFMTDRDGVFQYVNRAFTEIYRYSKEEVIGKVTPRILKSGKNGPEKYVNFWQTILAQNIYKDEFVNKTKNGIDVTVEVSVSPILDSKQDIIGFIAIQTDVTEKKLLQEQNYRSQRLESLGTLAGGIAHDLNNVLAPILLATELLKNKFQDDHSRTIIETLERSANRGKGIVQQVLTFARGSEGERGEIQPKHIIREIEKIINETFPKSIECHTIIEKNLWTVMGDLTQLHQVILNLCVNARDAMPNGGVLTLKAENRYLESPNFSNSITGKYVVVSVTDTGIGIASSIRDRIFDPFFTTKEKGRGTGLGLATVHSIVKSHNGYVHVDSQQGKGSTFTVFLPALGQKENNSNEAEKEETPKGHGEHLLVVDDEASVRDITKQTLEMFGYTVSVAADGTEAIAIYAKNRSSIEIVMTDIMMPVMDGYATIRALKKINPDLIIIASSGLIADYEIIKTTVGTIEGFLQKPFAPTKLLTMIDELLSKKRT